MNRYLIIDGNSISHAANAGTVLTVGSQQVQAVYGVVRTIRAKMAVYASYKPIVLWDGYSWRKKVFDQYKANRDKRDTVSEKRLAILKDSLVQQSGAIRKALTLLGIDQLMASNMEADDLAGLLVERYEKQDAKITLMTADRDWIQLVSDKTTWFDPINDRKVNSTNFQEKTGVETVAKFIEMKALTGDISDNIPGVGGIGEKGAKDFLDEFGSVANFKNLYLEGALDDRKIAKKFRDLCDDENKLVTFGQNIYLMDLRTKRRPKPENLKLIPGEPSARRFREFCDLMMFRSITQHYDNWISVFPGLCDEGASV